MMLRARKPLAACASQGHSMIRGLGFASSSRCAAASKNELENVLVEQRERVGIITFNRPKALNALNSGLIKDICTAAEAFEADPSVAALVLTGSEKAFAAGADIKQLAKLSYAEAYGQDVFKEWTRLTSIRKPIIAAVNGYALGGGCELAMMCDIILAGDKAVFGQPEISLGLIPGWGGTQRLVRAVGKSKAMQMVLTGSRLDANQAERDGTKSLDVDGMVSAVYPAEDLVEKAVKVISNNHTRSFSTDNVNVPGVPSSGLVSAVYPAEDLVEEAVKVASTIGSMSMPIALMAKEAVNAAFEGNLTEGVRLERRIFHATFALDDQKEGTSAFAEKRIPKWTHK